MGEYSNSDLKGLNLGGVATVEQPMDASSNKLLGASSDIHYTPPAEINPDPSFGRGVEKGLGSVPQLVGQTLHYLGSQFGGREDSPGNSFADRIVKTGLELADKNQAWQKARFPEKPDLLEKLGEGVGGGLPMAAGLGIGMLSGADETALVLGGAAAISGQTGVSSFNAFKEKGDSTIKADLKALIPAGVAGGLALTGLGAFLKTGGAPMMQVATNLVNGSTMMTVQAAATGETEHAMGINNQALKDRIVGYAVTGASAALLLGPIGAHAALKYHGQIEDTFKELGLDDETAKAATTKVMIGVMDKGLEVTEGMVGNKSQTEGRIKVSNGLPIDEQFPSVQQGEDMHPDQVAKETVGNKYVRLEEPEYRVKPGVKETASDIIDRSEGNLNANLQRGSYLERDLKLAVKDPVEQEALFVSNSSTPAEIKQAIEDPEAFVKAQQAKTLARLTEDKSIPKMQQITEEYLADHAAKFKDEVDYIKSLRPELEKSLNLSPEARVAKDELSKFYNEHSQIGRKLGTLKDWRENYSNRLYKPEPGEKLRTQKIGGLVMKTYHKNQQFYSSPLEAAANGKQFATKNAFELANIYNRDMSYVNHGRQLAEALHDMKLAKWMPQDEAKRMSDKFKQFGDVSKTVFFKDANEEPLINPVTGNQITQRNVLVGAKDFVDAMAPIMEPDTMRDRDVLGIRGLTGAKLDRYIGAVKTAKLGLSLFHDKAMLIQTLASEGGWKTSLDFAKALKDGTMDKAEFRNNEIYNLKAGIKISTTNGIEDVMRKANLNEDALSKIENLPGVKQLADISQKHAAFLFDTFQRFIKNETMNKNMAAWDKRFPKATEEQRLEAAKGYAKATNATFGGLSWSTMGFTKTQVSFLRKMLLAPDWFVSAIKMGEYAATDWGKGGPMSLDQWTGRAMSGTAGMQARGTLFKAILGGYMAGNALSYMLHGMFMAENNDKHPNEVEIAPNVFVSPFAGGPGELVKILADMHEGTDEEDWSRFANMQGAERYAQGKMSPGLSAGVTALSGVNYYGGKIWKGDTVIMRDLNGFWNVAAQVLPVPIGWSGAVNYGAREEDQTPLGWAGVISGFGRFSKTQGE